MAHKRGLLGTVTFTAVTCAMVSASYAAVLNAGFSFAPLPGATAEAGTGIQQFDPALGTLTGLVFNIVDSATFSNGQSATVNSINIAYALPGVTVGTQLSMTGNGSVSIPRPPNPVPDFLFPTFAGIYTGTGVLPTSVAVSFTSSQPFNVLTTFGADSVTYVYDPARSAIPEPSSLVILTAAIVGTALTLKKRRLL